jgi:hypothetical protein
MDSSAGVSVSLSVAGAVTLLVVWPDTGPFAPPQQPSPQPAIPIAENTASAATVFSHSRLIRGLRKKEVSGRLRGLRDSSGLVIDYNESR